MATINPPKDRAPPLPSPLTLKLCALNLRSAGATRTAAEIEILARMLHEERDRTD